MILWVFWTLIVTGPGFGEQVSLTLFYFRVEKGGSLALGELAGAGATSQVADLILAVELTHGEVSSCSFCVEVAIFVGTG